MIDWRRGEAEDDTAACPHRVAEHHRPGALLRPAARHLRPVTKLLDLVERGRLEAAGSEDLEPPEQLGVTEDLEVGVGEGVGAGLLHRMHAVMRELARIARSEEQMSELP